MMPDARPPLMFVATPNIWFWTVRPFPRLTVSLYMVAESRIDVRNNKVIYYLHNYESTDL